MHNSVPKQYMNLAGKPMIVHVLENADRLDCVSKLVIVCAKEYRSYIDGLLEEYRIGKSVEYADAGETRQASVLSGLKKADTESVIIHEAARPFVKMEDYLKLINEPGENVMPGLDIPFTVIKGHDKVEGLLDRSELVNVQLPQKFNRKLITEAHLQAEKEHHFFTEDASLLHYYMPETEIRIIRGWDYDIKITTQTDMLISETIYNLYFRNQERMEGKTE
ncbi:MAG: 2-C-methyl-D-erythritol 4-phosphate cytidylyltransferase [Erysipelotrichaceae bacterium]|nr:2-C-methyl-D-erythritol 4-phosphate cytidylyltransferase [Erysipelotrichaceae bacterium]